MRFLTRSRYCRVTVRPECWIGAPLQVPECMIQTNLQTNVQQSLPGRNEACPCGSGKKYKHCCLGKASDPAAVRAMPAAPDRAQQAEALFRAGLALAEKGANKEAAQSFTEAIRLYPTSTAINALGVVLARMGEQERAVVCYRQAVALEPSYAAAHSNLGAALTALGRPDEAVASLQKAVELKPSLADARVNLAGAFYAMAQFDDAIAYCQSALKLLPEDADALLTLGNAYKETGRLAQAVEIYQRATASAFADPRPWTNLAESLRDQGKPEDAAQAYAQALAIRPGYAAAYSNLLYLHAFAHDISQEELLELARGFEKAILSEGERKEARHASQPGVVFAATPLAGRKLRVGIVSAELGSHAVAEFLQPLLESIDRERFEVVLFPSVNRWDARAQHLRSLAVDCFSLAGTSDADAVRLIRQQRIDVLMDTSGHTAGNRLGIFARRAAPVQCSYIGYWSTTGLTEMDWFISDPDAPAAVEKGFIEGLWRLPRIAVCYRGDNALDCRQWQPDPDGTVWLGSFNKYAKVREETLALWAKALHAVPQAKLLLEDRGTHDEESHERIRGGLAAHGVTADRVEFIPYVPGHERHMLLYNRLDIALDTVPFNSGTTAFDALWMGVPLVALDGDWIGGRMGASVLRTLGYPEWIAKTPEEYAEIVRRLAMDVEGRKLLRAAQREKMAKSEMTDAVHLARALQDSVVGMYEHWLARPKR